MSEQIQETSLARLVADQLPGLLASGGHFLRIAGGSMTPTLQDGDLVSAQAFAGEPRFGQILLIRHDGLLFIHRMAGRKGNRFRTKGDGRPNFDGWLSMKTEIVATADGLRRSGMERRFDGAAGRALCALAGAWSALCGHLYRVAFRLDAGFAAGEESSYREDIARLNRAGFLLIEVISRPVLEKPVPPAPAGCS